MPPRKKKTAPSKKAAPPSRAPAVYGLIVVLCGLVAGLLLLSQLAVPPQSSHKPSVELRVEAENAFPGLALVEMPTPETPYLVLASEQVFPSASSLEHLRQRLRSLWPSAQMHTDAPRGRVWLVVDGQNPVELVFQIPEPEPDPKPEPVPVPPKTPEGPVAAIIIDDLGRDLDSARDFLALDLAVTFSVLPYTASAAQVARLAHEGGREVLVHLPMEPLDYPEKNPGKNALFVGQTPGQIRERMGDYLARVPYAVGGNNHMGSRFTENEAGMRVVARELKQAGYFFVDSLTSSGSVADAVVRQAGVASAVRDHFLDNVRQVEAISEQIRRMAHTARSRGRAIGIGHPYPQTVEALRRMTPYLQQQGIRVVPVSRLVGL